MLAPERSIEDEKQTTQFVEIVTREYGSSGRTFKSALVWCMPDSASTLHDEARKLLAVRSASVGHRSPSDPDRSQHPKRLAAEHMVRQTLDGEVLLRPGTCTTDVADGYQSLCREGVIISHGTYAYRCVHDWLREYAIIDYLVSMISNPAVMPLLDKITTGRR